jgi:hypothetical protein
MSSTRNTVIRSLHDVGPAAWFGGALMGAVGVNGATRSVAGPQDDLAVAASGWGRWSPVAAAAVGVHVIGGVGLVLANRGRIAGQSGVNANTVVKTAVTGAAIASTVYSGILGAHLAAAAEADVPVEAATVPSAETPRKVASTQQQLRILQWVTPALTGVLIVLGAQQGEQQKPAEIAKGVATKTWRRARS